LIVASLLLTEAQQNISLTKNSFRSFRGRMKREQRDREKETITTLRDWDLLSETQQETFRKRARKLTNHTADQNMLMLILILDCESTGPKLSQETETAGKSNTKFHHRLNFEHVPPTRGCRCFLEYSLAGLP